MAFKDSSGLPIVALMPHPINIIAIMSIIILGLFVYLNVAKEFEDKFLCYDLKKRNINDIQESDTTL